MNGMSMLETMIIALVRYAIRQGIGRHCLREKLDAAYWAEGDKIAAEIAKTPTEEKPPEGLTPSQVENWRHMRRIRAACGADKEE